MATEKNLALTSHRFEPVIQKYLEDFAQQWREDHFSPSEIEAATTHLSHFAGVATQQIQENPVISTTRYPEEVPFTILLAERCLYYFLAGMEQAVSHARQHHTPQTEADWALFKNVAYHVFESSKEGTIALRTTDPEAPTRSEAEIIAWVGQSAREAWSFYIREQVKSPSQTNLTHKPVSANTGAKTNALSFWATGKIRLGKMDAMPFLTVLTGIVCALIFRCCLACSKGVSIAMGVQIILLIYWTLQRKRQR